MGHMSQDGEVMNVLRDAKTLAQKYRALTGKPLGITGEVAEYEAARILGLELTAARQAGYDAIEKHDGVTRRLQIKGRCLLPGCKPGQRLGSIDILKGWDSVILVLLDENFDATEIHEAERDVVIAALAAPGSKARNERGALAVSKFISIRPPALAPSGWHRLVIFWQRSNMRCRSGSALVGYSTFSNENVLYSCTKCLVRPSPLEPKEKGERPS